MRKRFLIGLVVGLLIIPAGALLYIMAGEPPVAVADPPLPFEKRITHALLSARIERQRPRTAPASIQADEATYLAGAAIYHEHCADCHGLPDHISAIGKFMFPPAPQLFERHGDHVGVSDDPPGETYWKVGSGIRLSGMPAFGHILNQTQIWQISLLLANADKLPPSVIRRLKPGAAAK